MAYTRFFYLPWTSQNDAGGLYTKFGGVDNGTIQANECGWTVSGRIMKSYGVTTDASRVPLTETELTDQFEMTNPAFSEWGRFLKYQYYSISGSQCAYLRDQIAAGHAPNYIGDGDGPWIRQVFFSPWAKFSYELMGVTSISGANFFHSTGLGTGVNPAPQWYKGRRMTATTALNGISQYFQPWNPGGIGLRGVYIWRPSTQAIVGVLVDRAIVGGYGPASVASAHNGYVQAGEPGTVTQGAGAAPHTFPTATSYFQMWYNYSANPAWYGYRYDVSGIQDHDVLVWEFWHAHWMNSPAVYGTYIPDYITNTSSFIVGGGTSGQPLTVTNTVPNWAPAWGVDGVTISGVEPLPPIENPEPTPTTTIAGVTYFTPVKIATRDKVASATTVETNYRGAVDMLGGDAYSLGVTYSKARGSLTAGNLKPNTKIPAEAMANGYAVAVFQAYGRTVLSGATTSFTIPGPAAYSGTIPVEISFTFTDISGGANISGSVNATMFGEALTFTSNTFTNVTPGTCAGPFAINNTSFPAQPTVIGKDQFTVDIVITTAAGVTISDLMIQVTCKAPHQG